MHWPSFSRIEFFVTGLVVHTHMSTKVGGTDNTKENDLLCLMLSDHHRLLLPC